MAIPCPIPVEPRDSLSSKILTILLYDYAKTLLSTYRDIILPYWPSIVETVKEINGNLTGEYVPYVTICGFKGVVEVCRLYQLTEEPGFVRVAVNVTPGKYLTVRIPYGILVAVNENIERRNYEAAIKILLN